MHAIGLLIVSLRLVRAVRSNKLIFVYRYIRHLPSHDDEENVTSASNGEKGASFQARCKENKYEKRAKLNIETHHIQLMRTKFMKWNILKVFDSRPSNKLETPTSMQI